MLLLLSCYECIEVLVVRDGIETGTGLGAVLQEITVSDDLGIGILAAQVTEESVHGHELFGSTSVLWTVIFGETAFVAHADALVVESLDMCADLVFRAADLQYAILANVIVIPDAREPTFLMVSFNIFLSVVLRQSGCRTMYHDPLYDPSAAPFLRGRGMKCIIRHKYKLNCEVFTLPFRGAGGVCNSQHRE